MKIAIQFKKSFFGLPNVKHYIDSIIKIGYELTVFVGSDEAKWQVEGMGIPFVEHVLNFNSNNFHGLNDLVVCDIEFMKTLKNNVSRIFVLEDKTNWADLYDYIWNEVR